MADKGLMGGVANAFRIIGNELPQWWRDQNAPWRTDITPADVAEFAFDTIPSNTVGLLAYSPEAHGAPKVAGNPRGLLGKIFNAQNITHRPQVPQRTIQRYVPPRGMPDRISRLSENEDAYKRIVELARTGMTDEGLGWYNMEALRKKLIEDLGEEAGMARFNRFIDLMAATSTGAKVPENIRIASYYDVLAEQGKGAIHPSQSPFGPGYGHKAQKNHNRAATEILAGGGLDPIGNPKRYSYGENLRGNWAPTTVDKHNMRAWGMVSKDPEWLATKLPDDAMSAPWWWDAKVFGKWDAKTFKPQEFWAKNQTKVPWEELPPTWFKEAPEKTEYLGFEQLNNKLARELGIDPAAAQAALWLGAGKMTGLGSPPKAAIHVMEDVIEKRAAARGVSKEQVWKDFVRGNLPLQWGGGLLGGGLLASEIDGFQEY